MAIEGYKLDLGGLHGGSWNQCSLIFNVDNATSDPQFQVAKDLLDDFNADQLAGWRGLFPNEYALQWLRAKRISVGGGQSRNREYPGSVAIGTRGGDTTSLAISPVVKFFPAMGVNTQGRIFLPTVSDLDLEDNTYTAGYATLVENFFVGLDSWVGSVSGLTWEHAIYSKKLATITGVAAVQLSAVIANQGKRRVPR
jgi:hypothetical protein